MNPIKVLVFWILMLLALSCFAAEREAVMRDTTTGVVTQTLNINSLMQFILPPTGTTYSTASVTVNPASATSDAVLLWLGVSNSAVCVVDEDGDLTSQATIRGVSVRGVGTTAVGVYGQSTSDYGVHGISTNDIGVYGQSTTTYGVVGTSTNKWGVGGIGADYGVLGVSSGSAGVYGAGLTSGVHGHANTTGYGVYGTSARSSAGRFSRNNTSSTATAAVVDIIQDSATGDTQSALRVQQDGTGDIVSLYDATTLAISAQNGGHLAILQDSAKLLLGGGSDASMYYDGADLYLKANEVSASDIHLVTGAAKQVKVDGAATIGAASTDTITCTGRMVLRTLASDPKDATPANRPAGSVAEVAFYSGKLYLCTSSSTPTWEMVTSE